MVVKFASTNIIPLIESFSAYPKWMSLAIRMFSTSSGGASEGMLDILVWFLLSPQTNIENYTPYLQQYTFHIREIKQMRIPHIRNLSRSHRHTLCARIPILHQCTARRDGISVVTTTHYHSSAVLISPRGEAWNHSYRS